MRRLAAAVGGLAVALGCAGCLGESTPALVNVNPTPASTPTPSPDAATFAGIALKLQNGLATYATRVDGALTTAQVASADLALHGVMTREARALTRTSWPGAALPAITTLEDTLVGTAALLATSPMPTDITTRIGTQADVIDGQVGAVSAALDG